MGCRVRSGELDVLGVFTDLSEVMFPRCGYMLRVSLSYISDTSLKDHIVCVHSCARVHGNHKLTCFSSLRATTGAQMRSRAMILMSTSAAPSRLLMR